MVENLLLLHLVCKRLSICALNGTVLMPKRNLISTLAKVDDSLFVLLTGPGLGQLKKLAGSSMALPAFAIPIYARRHYCSSISVSVPWTKLASLQYST